MNCSSVKFKDFFDPPCSGVAKLIERLTLRRVLFFYVSKIKHINFSFFYEGLDMIFIFFFSRHLVGQLAFAAAIFCLSLDNLCSL